ncbi:MAG: hypothetical protein HYX32_08970 [Actinobacteria bacterium]|nr:hypothetical protein [Actinomycetota bacterium]
MTATGVEHSGSGSVEEVPEPGAPVRPFASRWRTQPGWYLAGLLLIAVLAGGIRWANVVIIRPTCIEDIGAVAEARGQGNIRGFDFNQGAPGCFGINGDSAYSYLQGRLLAQGNGFVDGAAWFGSGGTKYAPSAGDPPLYALFLAGLSRVGLTSATSQRLASALVGVAGVVLIAMATRRLAVLFTAWGVGLALMLPWFAYNMTRFANPVLMTAQTGAVLSAANCDTTYYGDYIGYYANCFDEYVAAGQAQWPDPNSFDESQRDKVSQDAAMRYIREHAASQPRVMATRVLRMFDLYNPEIGNEAEPLGQNVRVNWAVEGRGRTPSRLGFLEYFVLLPLAVAGLVLLVRRRVPVSPLVAMPIVITVTAAITFGITRYRTPVDVMVVILAAVAADAVVSRWWPAPDASDLYLDLDRDRRSRPTVQQALATSAAPEAAARSTA